MDCAGPRNPGIRSEPKIAFRRVFDLACALVGVTLLSPLLLASALAVWWEDGGPVFYVQQRVGRDSRRFGVFKFRTMVPGADRFGRLTGPGDRRITRVGRWLRQAKIDELPQLFNVIRGEMQLVGPRPELAEFVAAFPAEYARLLREPPGITDPASLAYRDEERWLEAGRVEDQYLEKILPEKLRLSLDYMQKRTFPSDLEILLQTVVALVRSPRPAPGPAAVEARRRRRLA